MKKCPRDHFCRRRFSPVSLLHAVGVASSQSCNRVLLLAWENISSLPTSGVRQSHNEFSHLYDRIYEHAVCHNFSHRWYLGFSLKLSKIQAYTCVHLKITCILIESEKSFSLLLIVHKFSNSKLCVQNIKWMFLLPFIGKTKYNSYYNIASG